MATKILIWLKSGSLEAIKPGILYGVNAKKYKWVDDVKFVVFGEAEKLFLEERELLKEINDVDSYFCKFVAENEGYVNRLESLGVNVVYVGKLISDLIAEGYQVLTF